MYNYLYIMPALNLFLFHGFYWCTRFLFTYLYGTLDNFIKSVYIQQKFPVLLKYFFVIIYKTCWCLLFRCFTVVSYTGRISFSMIVSTFWKLYEILNFYMIMAPVMKELRVRVRVRFLLFYFELAPTDPWCNMLLDFT